MKLGRPRRAIRHGTPQGYRTHKHRQEEACQACKDAWASHIKAYRHRKRDA